MNKESWKDYISDFVMLTTILIVMMIILYSADFMINGSSVVGH